MMHKSWKRWVIVFAQVMVCLAFLVAIPFYGCGTEEERLPTERECSQPLRFREVDTFVFRYNPAGYPVRATVYQDETTGVKYLYIWETRGYGGPAMTRLWEE